MELLKIFKTLKHAVGVTDSAGGSHIRRGRSDDARWPKRPKFNGWAVCGVALGSFAAGSFITGRLAFVNQARADSDRVFELRVYHAVPGKLPALASRFGNTASKLLAAHDLKAVGYWVPENAPAWDNTLVYILAHPSLEEAKKHWDSMRADPKFQEMSKSEQVDKLVERVDSTYMRPTDFSPMK